MPDRLPRSAGPGRKLLFLGRFAIQAKGLDRLVDAFEKAAGPEDRLTLAGADFRGGLEWLSKRIKASPRSSQIELRGPAWGEGKYALFQEHDLFTHLSRWEGMPLAVVEAMAAGMPVVVSDATNTGDHVRAHNAGWVVAGEAFADALQSAFAASAEELDRRGAAAAELVNSVMSWPRHTAELTLALANNVRS